MKTVVKKLLVIDDEPSIRESLIDLLSDTHCQVQEVATATEALDLISKEAYDLIISDLRMPGISGIEFLTRLRSHQNTTPLIMMTAYADKDTVKKAWELGAVEYLEKPLHFDKLRVMVKNFIENGTFSESRTPLEHFADGSQRLSVFFKKEEIQKLQELAAQTPIDKFVESFIRKNLLKK